MKPKMSLMGVSEVEIHQSCRANGERRLTGGLDEKREEGVHARARRDEVRSEVVVVVDSRQAAITRAMSVHFYKSFEDPNHLSGTKNSSTAFSCTCHPHRKLVNADKTSESRNRLYEGSNQSFERYTREKARVREKVSEGVMLGRTPKVVSWINPREVEVRAVGEMGQPRLMRSVRITPVSERTERVERWRTFDEDAVHGAHDRPDVASPVRVIQPTLERKEAGKDLSDLRGSTGEEEGPEGEGEDGDDEEAQLDEAVGLEFCKLLVSNGKGRRDEDVLPDEEKQCRRRRKTKKGGAR